MSGERQRWQWGAKPGAVRRAGRGEAGDVASSAGGAHVAALFRRLPLLAALLALMIAGLLGAGARAEAGPLVYLNAEGGTGPGDGIKVAYADGQFQVYRDGIAQLYSPKMLPPTTVLFNGVRLALTRPDGTGVLLLAGRAPTLGPGFTAQQWTVSTEGGSLRSGSFTSDLSGTVDGLTYTVHLTTSYVYPADHMVQSFTVDIPAGNQCNVKLYDVYDTYLGGSDTGPGFYTAAPATVGVTGSGGTTLEALRYVSGPAWAGYASTFYRSVVFNTAGWGAGWGTSLPDEINVNAATDNGMGVNWDFGAPGTGVTTEPAVVLFTFGGGEAAPLPPATAPVATVGPGTQTISLSWTAPASGPVPTGYRVIGAPGGTAVVDAPTTSCQITGLDPSRTYTFTVTGFNASGPGLPSAPSNAVRPLAGTTLAWAGPSSVRVGQPLLLSARVIDDSQVPATPMAGRVVTFTFMGKDYTATSDANGVAETQSDAVAVGTSSPQTVTLSVAASGTDTAATDSASVDVEADTAPSVESGAATAVTTTSATVNGTVNANGSSTTVTFQYSRDPVDYSGAVSVAGVPSSVTGATGTSVSADLSGLTPGETYYYRVVGSNAAGTSEGAWESFTTTARAPEIADVQATGVTQTSALVQATVNAHGRDAAVTVTFATDQSVVAAGGGQETAADPAVVEGVAAVAIAAPAFDLQPNTTYYYRVSAANTVGTTNGDVSSFTTDPGPPSEPLNVTAAPGDGSAEITFAAPQYNGGSAITGYEYALDESDTWVSCTSPYTLSGLTNGTEYVVRIRARNSAGPGPADGAAVIPRTTPGAPTNLSATPQATTVAVAFTAPDDGGAPITNYEYSLDDGASWTALDPADAASPVTVGGLTAGSTYTVRLRAVNAAGPGPSSAALTVVTTSQTLSAPSIIAAVPGDGTAKLIFIAPLDRCLPRITNYEYSLDGGEWVALSPAATRSPITICRLTNGRVYCIRLRAVNSAGAGAASGPVRVTPRGVPSAPTCLRAVGGTKLAVVTFRAPASDGGAPVSNYQYQLNGGAWVALKPSDTASPVTITGLTARKTYEIRLRALNAAGPGAASEKVKVTIK